MNVDLGSSVLDVAFGLSFVFFIFSIVATAVTEGIAWLLKRRSSTLVKGIKGMLGDDTLAGEVLGHPLVRNDLSAGAGTKPPSYLSSRTFALALTSVLRGRAGESVPGVAPRMAAVRGGAAMVGSNAQVQLETLLGAPLAGESFEVFLTAVEHWFDDAMERVSGWYKRWAQVVACVVALVVAIGLNVDSIKVAQRLYGDPAVRPAVVETASKAAAGEAKQSGAETKQALEDLKQDQLPFLWGPNQPDWSLTGILQALLGWLVTAIAISLGAPFWFDTLSRISRLRTTGEKPETAKPGIA